MVCFVHHLFIIILGCFRHSVVATTTCILSTRLIMSQFFWPRTQNWRQKKMNDNNNKIKPTECSSGIFSFFIILSISLYANLIYKIQCSMKIVCTPLVECKHTITIVTNNLLLSFLSLSLSICVYAVGKIAQCKICYSENFSLSISHPLSRCLRF